MKSAFSVAPTRVLSALVLGLGLAAPISAQEDTFNEAVGLYLSGRQEESLAKFKEVLAENPSNDQALAFLEQGGREVFFLMLVKEGEYEATAKRFLELAQVARKEKTNDESAISALVDQAMSGDYLDRRDALLALSANHGEYGAAPFVAYLGNDDDADARVNAITCLTQLGGDSVLPLIAALGQENHRAAWNAAACLGAIGDARAVPALKSLYESSSNETVKNVCNDALMKISGQSAGSLPSAADLHLEQAVQYFGNEATVVSPFDTKDAVWTLDGDTVTAVPVPAILRSLKLAEQNCQATLGDARAQAVLLATLASQKASVKAATDMGESMDGDVEAMTTSIDVSLASGGSTALGNALNFALEQDAPHSAVELIDALKSSGQTSGALNSALQSPYKMVRYHAAFALSSLGQSDAAVVDALVQALGEDAIRTVLVVDPNDDSRNQMVSDLANGGYAVVSADNGALGFARSRTLPKKDLIIVRSTVANVTLDQFVYDSDFRSSASPILVLCDEASKDSVESMYDGKGKVAGFLVAPLTADVLVSAVGGAMEEPNAERAAALKAAETAAQILAHMPVGSLGSAEQGLVAALDREEESVLVPVLHALGHAGTSDAATKVAAIFADSGRSEDVRVAAADAMAGIFSNMTSNPGPDLLAPMVNAAQSDDSAAVRVAAGRALGGASFLSDEERAALLSGGSE